MYTYTHILYSMSFRTEARFNCEALQAAPLARRLVADEPTGNLDSVTGRASMRLLRDIVQKTGIGLLVATHDTMVVDSADRVLQIHDGGIIAY